MALPKVVPLGSSLAEQKKLKKVKPEVGSASKSGSASKTLRPRVTKGKFIRPRTVMKKKTEPKEEPKEDKDEEVSSSSILRSLVALILCLILALLVAVAVAVAVPVMCSVVEHALLRREFDALQRGYAEVTQRHS